MKTSKLMKKAAAAIFLMLLLLNSVGSTVFAAQMSCKGGNPNDACLSEGPYIP